MPDITHRIVKINKASICLCQKNSTLWPIFRVRSLSDELVGSQVLSLQDIYRDRLVVLKEANWSIFDGNPAKLQFMRNCPPTIVTTDNPSPQRRCKSVVICPWCHTHRIEAPYAALASYLAKRGGHKEPVFNLVEISNSLRMSEEDAGSYVDSQLGQWFKSPHGILKRYKPLGALWRISVDPRAVSDTKSAYNLSYRILAMVPAYHEVPAWLDNGHRKIRVTEMRSRRQLIGVLARHYRYPVGMLWGDPVMTVKCLHGMQNRKCTGMTGCFRSNRQIDLKSINMQIRKARSDVSGVQS